MYPVVFKNNCDQFTIMDVNYKGIWSFDKKHLLAYFFLLENDHATEHDELIRTVRNFVEQEQMPRECNFQPSYLARSIDTFGTGIITPPTPVIEVTDHCNYRCPWCYLPDETGKGEKFSLDHFEHNIVFPLISKFGLLDWCFSGGEPLTDVSRTVEMAAIINRNSLSILGRLPKQITLLTNGYELAKNAELLVKSGIAHCQVSLASPIPKKDVLLRRPPASVDSYKNAIDGISALKDWGAKVDINMVVLPRNKYHDSNIDDIEAMFDLADTLRIDKLRITPAIPTGRAFKNNYSFTADEYSIILNSVRRMKKKEREFVVDCPLDVEFEPDRPLFCGAGTQEAYINSIGECFPCNNLQDRSLCCSADHGADLADIWLSSDILRSLRQQEPIHEDCIGCADRVICSGDCRALCFARYGVLNLDKKPVNCYTHNNGRR